MIILKEFVEQDGGLKVFIPPGCRVIDWLWNPADGTCAVIYEEVTDA